MNLQISADAEVIFNKCAKVAKSVAKEVVPWYAIFEVRGEEIDVATHWPTEAVEITPENWLEKVWEPLVELISTQYAKNACYVVVEVLYTNSEGNPLSTPVFFKWCPDSGVPIRTKMLIGSSFQSAKKKLDVVTTTPELSQRSQLEINQFAAEAKLKQWVPL